MRAKSMRTCDPCSHMVAGWQKAKTPCNAHSPLHSFLPAGFLREAGTQVLSCRKEESRRHAQCSFCDGALQAVRDGTKSRQGGNNS
jgi:hypothetical protein